MAWTRSHSCLPCTKTRDLHCSCQRGRLESMKLPNTQLSLSFPFGWIALWKCFFLGQVRRDRRFSFFQSEKKRQRGTDARNTREKELSCKAGGTSFANFIWIAPVSFVHCRVCRRSFFVPVCSKTQSLFRKPKNVKNLVRIEADALTSRGWIYFTRITHKNDLKRSNYYMDTL